jgi:O-antigen/teichoic acid export membrane protein
MTTTTSTEDVETSKPENRRSTFAGDVLKLVSGTTFAQILTILISPLLTRLYSPADFGLLALFTSITTVIGAIACLRYELSIMLPDNEDEAANLLGLSLLLALVTAILSGLLVWLAGDSFVKTINAPGLKAYLWLVPPMVLFSGVFLALNYWNSRTRHFGRLSLVRISRSVITSIAKLSFGYGGFATGGTLIGATVGGQALSTILLGNQIWRSDRELLRNSIRWRGMFSGMKRYRKFPLYDSWSTLLNNISQQLPSILLSCLF